MRMMTCRHLLAIDLLLLTAVCMPILAVQELHDDVILLNKVHVSILNRLGEGRSMRIHCRSKDDDLGEQIVGDRGEYGFGFTAIFFFGKRFFYCNIGLGTIGELEFKAFDYRRDRRRCKSRCRWIMAEEGVYGFNEETGLWEYMYGLTDACNINKTRKVFC